MKRLLLTVLACCVGLAVRAADLEWLTDLPGAQAKAKSESKLVFINFSGSDWNAWCNKLDKDVFRQPEFVAYARKNLVLVLVDFPVKKPLSAEQKNVNEALKNKFGVRNYPTVIILNAKGDKVYEREGYMGEVKKWIEALDNAKTK
jgi:protein disulfide-isomerase